MPSNVHFKGEEEKLTEKNSQKIEFSNEQTAGEQNYSICRCNGEPAVDRHARTTKVEQTDYSKVDRVIGITEKMRLFSLSPIRSRHAEVNQPTFIPHCSEEANHLNGVESVGQLGNLEKFVNVHRMSKSPEKTPINSTVTSVSSAVTTQSSYSKETAQQESALHIHNPVCSANRSHDKLSATTLMSDGCAVKKEDVSEELCATTSTDLAAISWQTVSPFLNCERQKKAVSEALNNPEVLAGSLNKAGKDVKSKFSETASDSFLAAVSSQDVFSLLSCCNDKTSTSIKKQLGDIVELPDETSSDSFLRSVCTQVESHVIGQLAGSAAEASISDSPLGSALEQRKGKVAPHQESRQNSPNILDKSRDLFDSFYSSPVADTKTHDTHSPFIATSTVAPGTKRIRSLIVTSSPSTPSSHSPLVKCSKHQLSPIESRLQTVKSTSSLPTPVSNVRIQLPKEIFDACRYKIFTHHFERIIL